jgi:hypothetical protein
VVPLVLLHAAGVVEPFSAHRTHVGGFPRVSPHVHGQIPLQSETLGAIRARIRSFAAVGPQVVRQVRQLGERLGTVAATVGFEA